MPTSYVPNNDYVFLAAFLGAQAGILGKVSQTNADTEATYSPSDLVAGAWAQAVDTAWGVSTNPDLFQYSDIEDLSHVYWTGKNLLAAPLDIERTSYVVPARNILLMVKSGEDYIGGQGIPIPALPSAGGAAIVWRPGVAPVPGVAETWAQIAAFIAANNVPVTVYVDSSIAVAIVPGSSGITNCKGSTRFLAYRQTNADGSLTANNGFTIQDGASLLSPQEFGLGLSVQCQCTTTAALVFNFNVGAEDPIDNLIVADGGQLTNLGTVPAIVVPDGAILALLTNGGGLGVDVQGAGSAPVIQLNGTGALDWTAEGGGSLGSLNSVAGGESTTLRFVFDNNVIQDLSYAGSIPAFLGAYGSQPYNRNISYGASPLTGIDPTAAAPIIVGVLTSRAVLSGFYRVSIAVAYTGATAADTLAWAVTTDDAVAAIPLTGAVAAGPGFFIPTGNGGITLTPVDAQTVFTSGTQVLPTGATTGIFMWSGIVGKNESGANAIPFPLGNNIVFALSVNRSAHAMTFQTLSMSAEEI